MTNYEGANLLAAVSETVLSTIATMSARQKVKKAIHLDSISLVLKISVSDLKPIIQHLQNEGHLIVYPNQSGKSRGGGNLPDSVLLN